MFDVIWTDHDRELQGEHRAKKEAAKESSKKQKRTSLSTKRSSVSSGDSPFSSFFRGHGLKRINTSDARSASSSRLASPSPLATSFDGRSPRSSGAGARPAGPAPAKCSGEQGRRDASVEDETSVNLSRHGSIFSKYAESDNLTSNSTGDISILEQKRSQGRPAAPVTDTQPTYENATWPRSAKKLTRPVAAPLPPLIPGSISPARPKRPSVRPVYLDTWETPDLWSAPFDSSNANLQPTIEVLTSMLAECTARTERALDVKGWKEDLVARSAMKLEDAVQALRGIWRIERQGGFIENQGSTSAHELQWMLWALKHLDPRPERDNSPSTTTEPDTEIEKKILILYDSPEIATYLAATNPKSQALHVTTQPSSSSSSSNAVKTVTVNSLRPTDFPYVKSYSTITTLTLPSLLPAVDIPPLLTAANRALAPGGSLHLLLIDPMPRPGTLGRHMRAWMRTNLLPNIERSFRCANPSSLFPEWLAAASLRGKGSTITTTKFFANPARVHREALADVQSAVNNDHDTRVKKAEIRSLTGRTLWKTIWGPFVSKGATMWWEDPICAEECVELGTIWEYHFIEGIKDAEAV